MKHIVRSVRPHDLPFIFQGEMEMSAGIVDPSTVQIFQVWTNFDGIEMVGPEIVPKKTSKSRNDIAIRLTRQYRHHARQDKN